jgi:hypothetical protein
MHIATRYSAQASAFASTFVHFDEKARAAQYCVDICSVHQSMLKSPLVNRTAFHITQQHLFCQVEKNIQHAAYPAVYCFAKKLSLMQKFMRGNESAIG